MATLATDVYVDGVLYAAGEEAPEGVTNPAAFDADEWARDSLDPVARTEQPASADEAPEAEPDEESDEDDEAPEAPPLNGPGSGRDAWVAYAESLGIEVTDDMGRDAIVAATQS